MTIGSLTNTSAWLQWLTNMPDLRYLNDETEGRSMMAMRLHLEMQRAKSGQNGGKRQTDTPRSAQCCSMCCCMQCLTRMTCPTGCMVYLSNEACAGIGKSHAMGHALCHLADCLLRILAGLTKHACLQLPQSSHPSCPCHAAV